MYIYTTHSTQHIPYVYITCTNTPYTAHIYVYTFFTYLTHLYHNTPCMFMYQTYIPKNTTYLHAHILYMCTNIHIHAHATHRNT